MPEKERWIKDDVRSYSLNGTHIADANSWEVGKLPRRRDRKIVFEHESFLHQNISTLLQRAVIVETSSKSEARGGIDNGGTKPSAAMKIVPYLQSSHRSPPLGLSSIRSSRFF